MKLSASIIAAMVLAICSEDVFARRGTYSKNVRKSLGEQLSSNEKLQSRKILPTLHPIPKHPKNHGITTASDWKLTESMSGYDFWSHWYFYSDSDPTGGLVNYVNSDTAFSSGLAGNTDSGSVYMRADNQAYTSPGEPRNSVRISSHNQYSFPAMFILDANHMPYGKTTWPAFWISGDNWPYGGELDIYEGTNLQLVNQMGMHTGPGCNLNIPMPYGATGAALTSNCDALIQSNTGCVVRDSSQASYGEGFANAGGGVYATVWDYNGMAIYFFDRGNVPQNIYDEKPDPSSWGAPSAFWDASGCDPQSTFSAQRITFDITICASWATHTWSSEYGYPGTCEDAMADRSNYDTAYFDVNYVKVYSAA